MGMFQPPSLVISIRCQEVSADSMRGTAAKVSLKRVFDHCPVLFCFFLLSPLDTSSLGGINPGRSLVGSKEPRPNFAGAKSEEDGRIIISYSNPFDPTSRTVPRKEEMSQLGEKSQK